MTTLFAVGAPSPIHVDEGTHLHIEGSTLFVFLALPDPTPAEVHGAKAGRVEVRVLGCEIGLLLLLRITPGFPWCDAPYELWRAQPRPVLADLSVDKFQALLILVDSASQRVCAVRAFPTPLSVHQALCASLRAQAARPCAPSDAESESWYRIMMAHTTDALAEMAARSI